MVAVRLADGTLRMGARPDRGGGRAVKWPWSGDVGPTATQLRQRVLAQLNGKARPIGVEEARRLGARSVDEYAEDLRRLAEEEDG